MKLSDYKAIIVDIDETLTEFISWIRFTADLGESMEKHSEIYKDFITNKISLQVAERLIVENWSNNQEITKEIVDSIISKWKYRENAKEVIKKLQNEINVVFISGSIQPFYDLVCKDFDITLKYNLNKFYWDKDKLVRISYSPDKAEYFNKFLSKNSLKGSECIMIGDGDNDIKLFEECGYSILFEKPTNVHLRKYCDTVISKFSQLSEILL